MISKPSHPPAIAIFLGLLAAGVLPAVARETELHYLSGHGPKDAVPWGFCVTKGRRAGEWTTIPVPSNWEQQGFGTYNYGESPGPKADEHGLYRLKFAVPDGWKDRRVRIVFDGVMTDAAVKVNGQPAGPIHQGGFYRFRYDITKLLKPGQENLLEVDVSKVSANPMTENAERSSDYWVFGGIFRQVFLEAVPQQAIERVAVDARADGNFKMNVDLASVRDADLVEAQIFSSDGKPVGEKFSASIPGGGTSRVELASKVADPALWTAETPNLYQVHLTLSKDGQEIHSITQRFGFRTVEVRKGEGIFVNGKHVLLKGVGRHSFRPETGRALDAEDCYDDVRLLKGMNLNAVRMTHYPPDVAFLEACDELGLYVIDELSGWQHAHDTENGRKIVREMVNRDVNHPGILFWDNGNEGGWNRELDGEFALYDPQKRLVLHPWEAFNGVDTKHYPNYEDLTKRLAGPNIVMPTEMIHGLYDGGAGAGLEDYWKAISASPFGGGGFIWVLADEGIMRTDQSNRIDVYSTYAPDGILGPHHEKKGSYNTVREIFSPVRIDAPQPDSGKLTVHNRYDFRSLAGCRFSWNLLRFPKPSDDGTKPEILNHGDLKAPDVAAGKDGTLDLTLPSRWQDADALSLSVTDSDGQELWTWSWATSSLASRNAAAAATSEKVGMKLLDNTITLNSGEVTASFGKDGRLVSISNGKQTAALTNGPRLVYARPAKGEISWSDAELKNQTGSLVWTAEKPQLLNLLDIDLDLAKHINWAGFKLEISPDGQAWKTLYDGTRRKSDGSVYEFPPQPVAMVRISSPLQVDGGIPAVKRLRIAYQADRFPAAEIAPRKVTTGPAWLESVAADDFDRFRWTLSDSGELRLDYSYKLDGDFTYHGITFDHPEDKFRSVKWLGEGPYRVWQNRLLGTTLGVHEIARNDIQPGESWGFPEFQGCFAGMRWARFETESGPLTVSGGDAATYLRIGTPRISHPNTTVAFPAGDLSFLHAIPAIGSKFILPDKTGPASMPAKAAGEYRGSLVFRLGS